MQLKPFRGLRPVRERVGQVASRPYDVLNSEEARAEAAGNPYSFLNVVKPEILLPPDTDPYSPEVYATGRQYFHKLQQEGTFFQDRERCFYIYELTMAGRSQSGIVGCAAVEDYIAGRIKKHELTRPDKEADRKQHVRVSMLNAEPVFFAYRARETLDSLVETVKTDDAEYDFVTEDGIRHRLWVINAPDIIESIIAEFDRLPATYVADGHHRTAAAALVGHELKNENPQHTGTEEYNYFLAVHFPDNQLAILDYNRLIKDLNGLHAAEFLQRLANSFIVEKHGRKACKPWTLHSIGMYLEGSWYTLQAKPGTYDDSDPVGILDVTILSEQILNPVLDIHDLRTDKRIEFVGGVRGMSELERRVDSGEMALAFAMYPVSMQQLMDIADSGKIMPPKVTWFEPKLRSGLVVHSLQD
jgi:uncharacterized protein (DUF1015 family)